MAGRNIKFKRGLQENFAALTLQAGEPAFVLDEGKLYIGNGTDKVLINKDNVNTLTTARTISLSGDATGSTSFDGSKDVTLAVTLPNSGVSANTYTKFTVNAKGLITGAETLAASDIPTLTLAKISDAGTAASKDIGTASGNVPVLDSNGKLAESVIPALAITDVFEAANESAMLALSSANRGDVAIRSDLNKCFILKATPASALTNWVELKTPTDVVLSVNGKTGTITLTPGDIGAEPAFTKGTAFNKDFETNAGNIQMDGTASAGDSSKVAHANHRHPSDTTKAPLASPALTGTPTAPTAATATNTTQIATTAFVKAQGYATLASPTFTGTPKAPTATKGTNTTQLATTAFVMSQGFVHEDDDVDGGTF